MIIRKAEIKDLKKLQELKNGLYKFEDDNNLDKYIPNWSLGEESAKDIKDFIENKYAIVAEENNNIVAFLTGMVYEDDTYSCYQGLTAELENIFIEEQFRHQGIGDKLIQKFLEYCLKNNAQRVLVTASFGNNNAINFYNKYGFKDHNVTLMKEF